PKNAGNDVHDRKGVRLNLGPHGREATDFSPAFLIEEAVLRDFFDSLAPAVDLAGVLFSKRFPRQEIARVESNYNYICALNRRNAYVDLRSPHPSLRRAPPRRRVCGAGLVRQG
ncbi:MAG: hypothetical protein Q4E13_15225, partial [Clostridia bacterium]|nr:hypothetical protein [Clostridia bacterium]